MKPYPYLAGLSILVSWSAAWCQETTTPFSVESIQQRGVIGRTGVPLGKVVVMEATIVAGDDSKRGAGRYFLKVDVADGIKLTDGPHMSFEVRARDGLGIPRHTVELYRFKHERDPEVDLSDEQVVELEKGFVGKQFKLYAYETGRFAGIPKPLPKGYFPWQDHGFMFVTELVVLGETK